MTEIHSEMISGGNVRSFSVPENVITASFCKDSGKLMTGECLADPRGERLEVGWFVDGTQPKSFCECHVFVNYDTVGKGVAFNKCRPENITVVGLLNVMRSFPCEVIISDAQYVWREMDPNLAPDSRDPHPFFWRMLGENEYCGISDTERQYNSACSDHCKFYPWE